MSTPFVVAAGDLWRKQTHSCNLQSVRSSSIVFAQSYFLSVSCSLEKQTGLHVETSLCRNLSARVSKF